VGVHAAARLAAERLRHEGRVHALLDRDLFDHGAERHDVVRRRECVRVAEVDLVLTGAALVVAVLDGDPEVLQHPDRPAAEVVRRASRDVVEVAGGIDGLGAVGSEGRGLQEVELDLGMRVERESGIRRLGEGPLEDVSRVGDGRLAVGRGDVAEHPRRRVDLAAPGQGLEGRRVGMGEQIRLVRPREALDGGSVEAETLAERALYLGRRDRNGLQRPDHVGEPESDELDSALLDRSQDEVALLVHRVPSDGRDGLSGPFLG
jgi:hypothetical protein